jgi:hypothetical protein
MLPLRWRPSLAPVLEGATMISMPSRSIKFRTRLHRYSRSANVKRGTSRFCAFISIKSPAALERKKKRIIVYLQQAFDPCKGYACYYMLEEQAYWH